MGNDSVSPVGASKTYDFNFEAIKKRLLGGKNDQQDTTSFLAQTPTSVKDFSRIGTVPHWNDANVPMTGYNIT